MKLRIGFIVGLIIVIALLPSLVTAASVTVLDPIPGGSWASGVLITPGSFAAAELEAFIIYEDPAADPVDWEAFISMEQGGTLWINLGWTGSIINPDYLYASGTALDPTQSLQTWWQFSGNQSSQSFDVHWFFNDSAGNNLTSGQFTNRKGLLNVFFDSNLDVNSSIYDRTPSAVPEPSTLLLIGVGLIGLAGFRRKFRV